MHIKHFGEVILELYSIKMKKIKRMEINQRPLNKIIFVILFFILFLNSCSQSENKELIIIDNQTEKSTLSEPTIVWEKNMIDNQPRRNFGIIDYDKDYLFVGRHFGDSRDRGGNTEPAFFVHSKKIDKWLKIKQISTKKGIFGYSEKLTKEESRRMMFCSVYIGQTHLANQEFSDLPLTSGGFPDKITFDTIQKEYNLHFFSSWQIEKVKTILKFKKEDLDFAFSKEFKNKKK